MDFGVTPYFPQTLLVSQKVVRLRYPDVTIELSGLSDLETYYELPSLKYRDLVMLVTDRSIVFVDSIGQPVSITASFDPKPKEIARRAEGKPHVRKFILNLGPFWVLDPSLNEELDQEFRANPTAYSRYLRKYWWARGYRDWTWVSDRVDAHPGPDEQGGVVEVPTLARVGQIRQWGPERPPAAVYRYCSASVFLKSQADAAELKRHINNLVRESSSPVTQEYIARTPWKRASGAYLAYTYLFWALVGGLILLIIGALILSSVRASFRAPFPTATQAPMTTQPSVSGRSNAAGPRANAPRVEQRNQPAGTQPAVVQAIIQAGRVSLRLPPGRLHFYGMVTGGGAPSSAFVTGQYAQATNAARQLSAALAYGTNNENSFSSQTAYHDIGGVSVAGSWDNFTAYYGSNSQRGASNVSASFVARENSLVVVIGLASSQQYVRVQGVPGLQIDASRNGGGIVIAHGYVRPGMYTVVEQSKVLAAGQDPEHMADLLGVFVLGSKR